MEYALALQGMALDSIKKTFASEDTTINISDISYGEYMKALVEADDAGTREEFEAEIGRQITVMMQQQAAMAAQGEQ